MQFFRSSYLIPLFAMLLIACGGQSQSTDPTPTDYEIADGHYAAGEYAQAGDFYAKAARAMPGNHHAAIRAARSYALAGDTEKALEYAQTCYDWGRFELDHADLQSLRGMPAFETIRAAANAELDSLRKLPIEPLVYLPENYDSTQSYPLAVMFSGYGQNAGRTKDQEFPEVTAKHGLIWLYIRGTEVIGRDAFHWDYSETEKQRILATIAWCIQKYPVREDQIVLYGFFTGIQWAAPLGVEQADRFRGIVLDGGPPPAGFAPAMPDGAALRAFIIAGGADAEAPTRQAFDPYTSRGLAYRLDPETKIMDQKALVRAFDWILGTD